MTHTLQTQTGFGFVQDWYVMIPLRLLLGRFENRLLPRRCVPPLNMLLHGLGDLEGWRWTCVFFGILRVIAAVCGWFFLVDFPDVAVNREYRHFLRHEEIDFIIRRINKVRDDAGTQPWNLWQWASAGKDWKIWILALQFFGLTTQAYALAFFLPIILRHTVGFNAALSQRLTAPRHAGAAIIMFLCAWVGDRCHVRGPLLLFHCSSRPYRSPSSSDKGSRIRAGLTTSVKCFGCFSSARPPTVLAYQPNNIRGQQKRAFASATLVGFGIIGGIAGSTVFPYIFKKENKRADKGEVIF
ncbi:hypothetical protein NLU13_3724 [Sarocladium strictum]|uniref:Uncharacterized protein n=1 Tax=Sarocladium strictum TaxID=5046 RepID=A0AA39LA26_SARSR|nr:hypothetical protein NLU13_3724 [Sarocladium strictum]